MSITAHRTMLALCMALCSAAAALHAQSQMPRTTKERISGVTAVKTEHLKGTVVQVENNHLAVRMASGELKTFDVSPTRKFIIDGKQLSVNELQPGTRLTATILTKTTPVTERTTTIGSGKVWMVSGNTVIVTLPDGENRMYTVDENYRFTVEGQPAPVHQLRPGMTIAAQKIVEEPRTEIASDMTVTGEAPRPAVPKKPHFHFMDFTPPSPVQGRPAPSPPKLSASGDPLFEAGLGSGSRTVDLSLVPALGFLSIGASLIMSRMRRF